MDNGRTRLVALASDRNWDYTFFLPLTCLFWQALAGFDALLFLIGSPEEWEREGHCRVALNQLRRWLNRPIVQHLPSQPTMEDCSLAQTSRLFASALPIPEDAYLMTADADMWPLSKTYWHRDGGKAVHLHSANAYGRQQFPLCYVGALAGTWREIAGVSPGEDIAARVAAVCLAAWGDLRGERNRAWDYDEKWFTARLKEWSGYPERCLFVDRPGSRHGLMSGRVDRAHWVWNGREEAGLVDAHLLRPGFGGHWARLREVVAAYLPERVAEADRYRDEFIGAAEERS